MKATKTTRKAGRRIPMTRIEAVAAVSALLALGACDYARREDLKEERTDKLYQAAVADYTAGRIEAAAKGFESAVKADPSNASARFQLAVLLQDGIHDYLGAMCSYRDYLMLAPDSDRARLAKDRMDGCEKLLATEFAKKYNLGDSAKLTAELEAMRGAAAESEKARAELAKGLAAAEARVKTLERELSQTKAVLKRMGEDDDDSERPRAVSAAVGAEEDDEAPRKAGVADIADDEDEPLSLNPEAKALLEEEEREEAEKAAKGSELLPEQTPDNVAPVKLSELGRRFGADGSAASADGRPKQYVVQEGETLSLIALRFYGRKSAWRRIQDANKATVPPTGDVKAGQTLVLP